MKNLLFVITLVIVLVSCTAVHQDINTLSVQAIKDTETSKKTVTNLLGIWEYWSGTISGYFMHDSNKYPAAISEMIHELDTIAALEEPTDEDLGRANGIFLKLTTEGPKAVLDETSFIERVLKILGITM